MNSFRDLEMAVRLEARRRLGDDAALMPVQQLIDHLQAKELVSSEAAQLIAQLTALRNGVAHGTMDPAPHDARRYADLVDRALDAVTQ